MESEQLNLGQSARFGKEGLPEVITKHMKNSSEQTDQSKASNSTIAFKNSPKTATRINENFLQDMGSN